MRSPRTSLALDRTRSPFLANMVEFRPTSRPKGGDISRGTLTKPPRSHRVSAFQRPVEGQHVATSTTATGTPNATQHLGPVRPQTELRQPPSRARFSGSSEDDRKHLFLKFESAGGTSPHRGIGPLGAPDLGHTSKLVANLTQSRHMNLHIR